MLVRKRPQAHTSVTIHRRCPAREWRSLPAGRLTREPALERSSGYARLDESAARLTLLFNRNATIWSIKHKLVSSHS